MADGLKELLGTSDHETTAEEQPQTISITPIKNCDPQERMIRALLILDALALRMTEFGDVTMKELQQFITDVYRIAHIGNGQCKNTHEDWLDTIDERAFQLQKSNTLNLEKAVDEWKKSN